jgi:succinylglutamate desuccinylase
MKLAVVCCLHGNERYGLEAVKRLPPHVSFFVANEKALKENKRFIDTDMNRCFPGKDGGNYEEARAFELLEQLKNFDYLIDLHSSSNNCPMFGIITKPNQEKIEFAKRLGLKKLVIMPEFFASGKALIDFVKCGVSIEVGPHERDGNVGEALNLIKNLETGSKDNLEIFEVFGAIKKQEENILIQNFEEVKKGNVIAKGTIEQKADFDFIPVLVNEEAYEGILCLACIKVTTFKNKEEFNII